MQESTILCMVLTELETATREENEYNRGRIEVCKKMLSGLSFPDDEIESICFRAKEIVR